MFVKLPNPKDEVFLNEYNIATLTLEQVVNKEYAVFINMNNQRSYQYGPTHPTRRTAHNSLLNLVNLLNLDEKKAKVYDEEPEYRTDLMNND